MLKIVRKRFLLLKKVKNAVSWTYVLEDLSSEEIAENFSKKES